MLLLGDISLVLLNLLQLYSISLLDFFLVLFILPLGLLFPFPAGISALFSHGPKRSAGLARVYALWNITSLINVVCLLQLNCFNIYKIPMIKLKIFAALQPSKYAQYILSYSNMLELF